METIKTLVEIDGRVAQIRVPSLSRKGVAHRVVISCSCEGFQFNGYCHHLAEAAHVAREDGRWFRLRTRSRLGVV